MKACFVGSSTGGAVSAESIVGLTLPRFRSAAYFVGSPIVDFRIANAIQCDTTETRELLQRQPYFSETMGWQEQFGYRFLISVDGNGAACSRLVIGLKSNSAVIKYRSPYSLFYFPIMVDGRDYIEVSEDRDVELVVQQELAVPGHFKAVAEAGKNFASRILNQNSVGDYTGALIGGYAKMFFG